jgi:hypothetical protein
MEDPKMTPILGDLIRESALPLCAIESDFAVDSTGFGTSRFVRWFDQKYGIVRQRAEFIKISVMTGIKTNVCLAVRIGGQYSPDSPEFIAHYHKRSNVESTFSMIKAKFGDSLRSKTDVAMMNEALFKVLCHNVAVLIQSACGLGIEATFWKSGESVVADSPL